MLPVLPIRLGNPPPLSVEQECFVSAERCRFHLLPLDLSKYKDNAGWEVDKWKFFECHTAWGLLKNLSLRSQQLCKGKVASSLPPPSVRRGGLLATTTAPLYCQRPV